MNLSYWEHNVFFDKIDVAIIGSGIVGLNAAINLKEQQPNLKIVVLERGSLPSGASTKNAGFACFGSISELSADLKSHSEAEMLDLVAMRWEGLQRLIERVKKNTIEFSFCGSYELFMDNEEADFQKYSHQVNSFNKKLSKVIPIHNPFQITDDKIAKFGFKGVKHLIVNRAEGSIHTGKMMAALLRLARAKGIEIINGVTIRAIENHTQGVQLQTEKGWIIDAQKVIVATNGFAQQLLPNIALKPARNQVLVTKSIPNLKVKGTFHYDEGYYYFRHIGNRVLFGGGRKLDLEGETTDNFGTTPLIKETLERMLKEIILPNQKVEIERWWSGIMGVGTQKRPIVKKINDNVIVAVRLGGMGVAIGSLIGEEAAKLV